MASLTVIPALPASGPRAGAVMGAVLGILALFSSLIWAFYLCKPGYCTCCGGGGGSGAPLIVEPPAEELKPLETPNTGTTSPIPGSGPANGGPFSKGTGSYVPDDQMPLIDAVDFGRNGKDAGNKTPDNASTGLGGPNEQIPNGMNLVIEHEEFNTHTATDTVDTVFMKDFHSANTRNYNHSNITNINETNVNTINRSNVNSTNINETNINTINRTNVNSANINETNINTINRTNVNNVNAAIQNSYAPSIASSHADDTRSRLESSVSAGGYSYAGKGSQNFGGGYVADGTSSTADYDIATGVHPAYYSLTLPTGRSGMVKGHSTSTLGSNYNYSMARSTRSLGGYGQGGYMGTLPNVIITPGPMGEEIRVDCCLMTSDGHSVVTGSSLGPPQVWNMTDGELLRIMHGEILGSTFLHLVNRDSMLVGAINADLEVNQYSMPKGVHNYIFQIWDFTTGRALDMSALETCSALTVMGDGNKVVFGRTDTFGDGTNIVVWDLLANQPIKEMRYDAPVGSNDYISFIAMSQDDRFVLGGYSNSLSNMAEFVVFDMALTTFSVTDPLIMQMDADPEVSAMLANDEVVTGLRNGDLVIWSMRGNTSPRNLISYNSSRAHAQEVKAVVRSNNNHYIVSASADKTLKIWDLRSERLLATLTGHHDEVWCAAISDDNEIIVSGSKDGSIRLWKLRTAHEICAFNAGVDVFYITMSHDKGTIVALGDKHGSRKLIMLQVVRSKVKRRVLASVT